MMLLGVVIHVAISYLPPLEGMPDEARWAYTDPNHTALAGILIQVIHSFRMPVFFVLSGFFAGMLIEKRGCRSFAGNRAARILVPFLVGWFILWPLTIFAASFATIMQDAPPGSDSITSVLARIDYVGCLPFMDHDQTRSPALREPNLLHLWFLYYLVLFCLLTVPLAMFLQRPAGRLRRFIAGCLHRITIGDLRLLRLPLLIGATFLMLMSSKDGTGIDTRVDFIPDLRIFATYLIFFMTGWVFHRHRELVEELQSGCWIRLALGFVFLMLGLVFTVAHLVVATNMNETDQVVSTVIMRLLFVASQATIAVSMWLVIFGLVGASERLFDNASPTIRYLVDASYWIYLAHLPLCILLPPVFRDWDAPGFVKMWPVMVVVTIPLLVSYHFLVRGTFVGKLLNGRRYPLVAPWKEPESRSDNS